MTLDKCIVLRIGTLTGCPLCRESHPLCRLKNPTVISIWLLVGFHPATRSVQSTPADNTRKRVWQYIEKERKKKKANSMLGLIVRSFDYLDKNSYIRLYKAMIRPQLEYGNAVWHPYLRKDIDSIEALQKRFTKLIPGLRD